MFEASGCEQKMLYLYKEVKLSQVNFIHPTHYHKSQIYNLYSIQHALSIEPQSGLKKDFTLQQHRMSRSKA